MSQDVPFDTDQELEDHYDDDVYFVYFDDYDEDDDEITEIIEIYVPF